ncbi:hypothetical protein OESDEN_02176 [Oesophagostomum dentatum]|uniref:Uncharacterized protein n=1 Tax=Oesophagostomum dentatum TaxID=61180 RepID=A0A0B1TP09_OESDE|nr:hypothetical protein OESDEN_02176 [Oesophagostomum dentatum]
MVYMFGWLREDAPGHVQVLTREIPLEQNGWRAISVDAQSELWAIDMENRLVRHLSDVYVPEKFTPIDAPNPFELV